VRQKSPAWPLGLKHTAAQKNNRHVLDSGIISISDIDNRQLAAAILSAAMSFTYKKFAGMRMPAMRFI
jgi:hypothetical protein